jgi:glyoxylase-like metal-dependent hydrolase (beta-lactamase superfamily II)
MLADRSLPDQQEALAEVGARGRLAAVVLTHHHGDHSGAAALAARFGAPIRSLPPPSCPAGGGPDARRRDLLTSADAAAVFTPGHAVGHLCFRDEDSGATVVGDMVAGLGTILIDPSGGHGDLPGVAGAPARRRRRCAVAGDGRSSPTAGQAARVPAHRRWRPRWRRCCAPRPLPTCVPKPTPTRRASRPLAERLAAHLVKLVEEGAMIPETPVGASPSERRSFRRYDALRTL